MKLIKKNNNIIENIIFLSFALNMILFFPTVYYCKNEILIFEISSIILFICLFYSIIKCKLKFPLKFIIFLIIYLIIVTFYWRFKAIGTLNCPYYLIYAFSSMMIFNYLLIVRNKYIEFFSIFVRFISIIAVISLFFWFFGSTLGIVDSTGNWYINWGGYRNIKSFYNIYFEIQGASVDFLGIHFGRKNCAIFTEAPMASFMFSLALIFNINYTKIKPYVINLILVMAILSTFSTMGFIVLLLCIMQKFMTIKYKSEYGKVFKVFFVIIIIFIIVALGYQAIVTKSNSISWSVRVSKISEEIKAFFNSPLLGNGFGKYTYGSSNSFFALLADGGLTIWGIYYIPIIYILVLKERKFDWFLVIYTCMFLFTVVQYNLIAIFMSTMLWTKVIVSSKEKNKNDIYSNSNL